MKKLLTTLVIVLIAMISYSQVPTPNPANGNFYCPNDIKVYGDQVIDPLATYSFSITPVIPFNTISSGDQIEVTWTTPGAYTIEITKTIGQCSSTSRATITVYPPTNPVVINEALCQGNGTINLTANPTGTNPVFTGTGVVGNTFNASGLPPGNYPITFTSTDANGCAMTGTGLIVITPPPAVPTIYTN
jgi:hypothetical protein